MASFTSIVSNSESLSISKTKLQVIYTAVISVISKN